MAPTVSGCTSLTGQMFLGDVVGGQRANSREDCCKFCKGIERAGGANWDGNKCNCVKLSGSPPAGFLVPSQEDTAGLDLYGWACSAKGTCGFTDPSKPNLQGVNAAECL